MEFKNLFDKFSTCGKLLLPDSAFSFDDIPWSVHPTFDGVELKNIITSDPVSYTHLFGKSIHIMTTDLYFILVSLGFGTDTKTVTCRLCNLSA